MLNITIVILPRFALLIVEPFSKQDAHNIKGYGIQGSAHELHPHYVSDRVVQFVMESTGAHCAVSDVDGEYSDGLEEHSADAVLSPGSVNAKTRKRLKSGGMHNVINDRSAAGKEITRGKELLFHASPVTIQAFKSVFTVALAQKLSKGFEIL